MAVHIKPKVTLAEFDALVHLPENSEKILELIGGEVFEVPSNPKASYIAARIVIFLGNYLLKNDIGYVTGADGGYLVNGDLYAPDVAYISYARQPELPRQGFNPNPPELAVEVISDPNNSQEQSVLRRKVANYLMAGVVVWVVNPEERLVEAYQIGQAVQIIGEADLLEGGELLPGFQLAVKDIFPQKKA